MNGTLNCPRCGSTLPSSAPEGLCPRCLAEVNLVGDTQYTGGEPPTAATLSPEELAPHFPQLEILECLGRGGMGVVYKARQRSLDRIVALKLLAPERITDSRFAERFEIEAQALARLSHPNIVTVHDFGQAGGFFYLLMEFVDGLNLRQLLRTRKLEPAEALAIVPPVCEALQYAHDHGVVHRDIKPENLLLDKEGRVKIGDFGIAKMLAGEGPAPGSTANQSAGTPQYMAPEQRLNPDQVDHRADIYSLGVVLYELLTGELPQGNFQPPSRKVEVDVRLDEIVLRALEKTPARRYQQASVFKTQIEAMANSPGAGRQVPKQRSWAPLAWVGGCVVMSGLFLFVVAVAFIGYFRTASMKAERAEALTAAAQAAARAQMLRAAEENTDEVPADVADVPALDLRVNADEMKRYFLIGLGDRQPAPPTGYRLLVVLPGGDGGAGFSPFVRRIYKNVLDQNWLVAQVVAPTWDAKQMRRLVWPRNGQPYAGARFATEELVEAVVADVQARAPLDADRRYLLAWSSGGPAAYTTALQPNASIKRAFIVMSIFPELQDNDQAGGRSFYLLHSPQDRTAGFQHSERARDALTQAGARVRLQEYEGGHGWHGPVWDLISEGVRWLDTEE